MVHTTWRVLKYIYEDYPDRAAVKLEMFGSQSILYSIFAVFDFAGRRRVPAFEIHGILHDCLPAWMKGLKDLCFSRTAKPVQWRKYCEMCFLKFAELKMLTTSS